jgi:hypothetical protein
MSTKQLKKPNPKGAVGIHINSRQQVIQEIVNPEIDSKRKAAIAKSPKIRREDNIKVEGMRDTWIMFHRGADKDKKMQSFFERTGKPQLNGVAYGDKARASRANRKNCAVEMLEEETE